MGARNVERVSSSVSVQVLERENLSHNSTGGDKAGSFFELKNWFSKTNLFAENTPPKATGVPFFQKVSFGEDFFSKTLFFSEVFFFLKICFFKSNWWIYWVDTWCVSICITGMYCIYTWYVQPVLFRVVKKPTENQVFFKKPHYFNPKILPALGEESCTKGPRHSHPIFPRVYDSCQEISSSKSVPTHSSF